jgi:Domain of unknown function (DUF5063)
MHPRIYTRRDGKDRMRIPDNIPEIASRFGVLANQFCAVIDSASNIQRTELLEKIYRMLPTLIGEAVHLPDLELCDKDDQEIEAPGSSGLIAIPKQHYKEWEKLYNLMKEKLGDWDSYYQVFDPTQDKETLFGTLADDTADIYLDLKLGLPFIEARPDEAIWIWRLYFYSHWGKHAMDAMLTIHFRLQNISDEG